MDHIYAYLEEHNIDVVPVMDEAALAEETVLLDEDVDDSFMKDSDVEDDIDLDAIDLLEGIGTEDPVRMYLKESGLCRCCQQKRNSTWQRGRQREMNMQKRG